MPIQRPFNYPLNRHAPSRYNSHIDPARDRADHFPPHVGDGLALSVGNVGCEAGHIEAAFVGEVIRARKRGGPDQRWSETQLGEVVLLTGHSTTLSVEQISIAILIGLPHFCRVQLLRPRLARGVVPEHQCYLDRMHMRRPVRK